MNRLLTFSLLWAIALSTPQAYGFSGMPFEQFIFVPQKTTASFSLALTRDTEQDTSETAAESPELSAQKNVALTHSLKNFGLGLLWEESSRNHSIKENKTIASTSIYKGQGLALMMGDHLWTDSLYLSLIAGKMSLRGHHESQSDISREFYGTHLRIQASRYLAFIPWAQLDRYTEQNETHLQLRRGIDIVVVAFGLSLGIGDLVGHLLDERSLNTITLSGSFVL